MAAWRAIVTLEDVIETILGLEITDELDAQIDMQQLAKERWKKRAAKMEMKLPGGGRKRKLKQAKSSRFARQGNVEQICDSQFQFVKFTYCFHNLPVKPFTMLLHLLEPAVGSASIAALMLTVSKNELSEYWPCTAP